MTLLAAECELSQNAVSATKRRSRLVHQNPRDASRSSRERLHQMYPARPAQRHEHTTSMCCLQSSPKSTMKKKYHIFTGVLINGKRSCDLMNPPFSASPATKKGRMGAIIDT